MPNPTLHIRILSPQQLILDTQAQSVTSNNTQGDFDILPLHANFITVIENEPIVIHTSEGKRLSFAFPFAIIFASNNQVNIYTQIQYK